jgi:hypothetical protein
LKLQKLNLASSRRYSTLGELKAITQLSQAPKGKRKRMNLKLVTKRHLIWRMPRKTCAVKPKRKGKQKNQLLLKASPKIMKLKWNSSMAINQLMILRTIQESQLSIADGAKPVL